MSFVVTSRIRVAVLAAALALTAGLLGDENTDAAEGFRILDLPRTKNDGDWSMKFIELRETEEADMMIRLGDIDNMNAGWRIAYDPFEGGRSRTLPAKWEADTDDPPGTDRVMVIGGPRPGDVFTTAIPVEEYRVEEMEFMFVAPESIRSAHLQLFVSGIEQRKSPTHFRLFLNGEEDGTVSEFLRHAQVEDCEGALLTVALSSQSVAALESGAVRLRITADEPVRSNGFAIDFVKLLLNTNGFQKTGAIEGSVMDASRRRLVEGARVSAQGKVARTDANGEYLLDGLAAGQVIVKVEVEGQEPIFRAIPLKAGQTLSSHF